jgi:trehalose-6-phosphate synthase
MELKQGSPPGNDGKDPAAKEFVATRWDERGVLITQPFTEAAHLLRDVLLANPLHS